MVDIGSKYEETRTELRRLIRSGEASTLEEIAEDNACYFCRQKIFGDMKVLERSYKVGRVDLLSKYYLHRSCYEDSKRYAFEGDKVIASLN